MLTSKSKDNIKDIIIELPRWLGDCVMTSPALENLAKTWPDCRWTLVGTKISTDIYKNHPQVKEVFVDNSKSSFFRSLGLFKLSHKINKQKYDIALSLRKTTSAKLLLCFIKAKYKFCYQRLVSTSAHQVIHYNNFINKITKQSTPPGGLKIYYPTKKLPHPTLAINPGASYGSAKRWYPKRFAEVAAYFSKNFNIAILGGANEKQIGQDIENELRKLKVTNFTNYIGTTSIEELCQLISAMSLFITADSGPMHIAAAYNIPTVSLFGPTKTDETSQWQNSKSIILKKNIACAPCMKRTCPLGHHKCMLSLLTNEVKNAGASLTNLYN